MKEFYSFDEFSIPFEVKALFWGLYIAVFIYAWKTLLSTIKYKEKKVVTVLFGVFFALYAVFYCINSDYFNYREWLSFADIYYWNKEKFYLYLVLFCRSLPFDYPFEVFRLIVWGGGIFLAYYTFRLYRELLLPGLTLLLLFVFHAGTFCYARASLAMAVYFLGIALYLSNDKKLLKLLGICVALLSYYFHHEMLVGIVLLPCLFIPFERKAMSFLSIFLLLVAIIAISFVSSNLEFLDQMFDNDVLSEKMEDFNEKEQKTFRLSTLIKYLKYFLSFYLITKYCWKKKVPYSLKVMYRLTYGILMVSVAFMIVFGLRSVYTYRIMYISMIPLTLMIGYGYNKGYFTRMQLLVLMLIVLLNNSTVIINAL